MSVVTVIKLFPDAAYTTDVILDEKSYSLRFYVNARTQLYHFDVINALGEDIALGLPLLPDTDTYANAGYPDAPVGYFYLAPFSSNTVFEEVSPAAVAEKYAFFYIVI